MAKNQEASPVTDEKSATRAQKQEIRAQRLAARSAKAVESGRPMRLCTLPTLELKKGEDGYHITLSGGDRARRLMIAPSEVGPVLRDLETAIQVIRGQQ